MKVKMKYAICILLILFGWEDMWAQISFRVLDVNTRMSGETVNYSVVPFANFIKTYNPDFVMLQEVDFNADRSNKNDFTTQLAAQLGMFPVFGRAINITGGEYGVAILSKYPLVQTSNNALTATGAKEQRTVLYVDVLLPSDNQKIRIACTHLDHSTAEVRSAMVSQLNSYVTSSDLPIILSGDFNAKPAEACITTGMGM